MVGGSCSACSLRAGAHALGGAVRLRRGAQPLRRGLCRQAARPLPGLAPAAALHALPPLSCLQVPARAAIRGGCKGPGGSPGLAAALPSWRRPRLWQQRRRRGRQCQPPPGGAAPQPAAGAAEQAASSAAGRSAAQPGGLAQRAGVHAWAVAARCGVRPAARTVLCTRAAAAAALGGGAVPADGFCAGAGPGGGRGAVFGGGAQPGTGPGAAAGCAGVVRRRRAVGQELEERVSATALLPQPPICTRRFVHNDY